MCMPSTEFEQPSLTLSPSSSSSSVESLQLSTSPLSKEANANVESAKINLSSSSCSDERWGRMHLCAGLLSILFIAVGNIDLSSLHNRASITSCSPSLNNEGAGSCLAALNSPNTNNIGINSDTQHRGKVIGASIKVADLATSYQSVKSEYAALASNRQWQQLSSHADGSEVSLLSHPSDPSCPYVRMTSIMPGTVQDVWDFFDLENWETSLPKIDPYYDGLTIHGDYKHRGLEMKLARKKTKRLVTFGKRDFTFLSVSEHLRDEARVSGTVSVVSDQIPREKGYVRAYQDSMSYYEPMEDDAETGMPRMKLTMMCRLDLNDSRSGGDGGNVPMWIYVKTVGTTAMASVQNMKRQIKLLSEEKGNTARAEKPCRNNWWKKIRKITEQC